MTPRRIDHHPAAVAEARSAVEWYRERDPAVALGFEEELQSAYREIEEHPIRARSHLHGTRRVLLRRFPYFVIYSLTESDIRILAVSHAKREPGYWRRRT